MASREGKIAVAKAAEFPRDERPGFARLDRRGRLSLHDS